MHGWVRTRPESACVIDSAAERVGACHGKEEKFCINSDLDQDVPARRPYIWPCSHIVLSDSDILSTDYTGLMLYPYRHH